MLHVHRAERADGLVAALRAILVDPLGDPFSPDVVAVPTRGVERWLAQQLSAGLGTSPGRSDGICANVAFPSPHRLVVDAVAAASGIDPDGDRWRPARAAWPLLDVLDEALGEPWLRGLSVHLGAGGAADDPRRARRFSSVRHLAELFDGYALYRPEMVLAWAAGDDTDAIGRPLPESSAWQAELWRRLRERVAQPSPAERVDDACVRLRAEPALVDLPQRVALFGLTRLPAGHLRVLRALAVGRDVHLLLLHPSAALWERVAGTLGAPGASHARDHDRSAPRATNRLLASWGQDARDMQLVIASAGEPLADHHHPVDHRTGTLLARIQDDVRADRLPPGRPLAGQLDARLDLEPDDRSIEVHSCHGRARQVEVLRDAILHLLAEDRTLQPRDVIVMCPDIEAFAPLIHATFGTDEANSAGADADLGAAPDGARPADLRVRLADRSLRQTNPLLGVVAQLIDLVDQRLTASQVLDLADREPVRRRFRLDDDDLARMRDWVAQSGIRWGLDADHRAPLKLDAVAAGTWRAGLDRILLGVAMTEDEQRLFGGALPLDDVDSGSIELVGRCAELVDRLQSAIDALSVAQPIDAWASTIAAAADGLAATSARDAWQRAELQRVLDEIVAEATATEHVSATPISLPELRALLADRLRGRPTRANFRTGHLTICTLVPMRSVPHRVVCLLGLDDGAFPRKAPRDGDDLLLDAPLAGDRNPRTEDRQMLLDALLAATDRLVVTYSGNDERTNTLLPPAVALGELLDVVDATARTAAGEASAQVVVRHPLQPFDPRNFVAGALVGGRSWSFDQVTLEGARALSGPRHEPGPFLPRPLPPLDAPLIEIDDVVRFAQHPVRAFLRRRLGISLRDLSEEVQDALPIELDGLGRWAIGQRILEARLSGVDGRTAILAEIARGTLPPGVLGQPVIDDVFPIVEAIVTEAGFAFDAAAASESIDVRLTLAGGRLLSGTVSGVGDDVLLAVTYSRVAAKHRIAAWVRLLAVTAARPERAFSAVTIGRASQGAGVTIARLATLAEDAGERLALALERLETLLDLYDRGMREPLPLYCATSSAYAQAAVTGGDAATAAGKAWTSEWSFPREDAELEHQLVLGGARSFDALLRERPRPDEAGNDWDAIEHHRLGRYARRMWDPLLASEELTRR
ncbi:MAG TPA: exodeoxyribonuclease V subunit gamma [Solirubrobacteraceae bacterium]|nr:exodeoxyribonuclease V subunit gamma [Solirubrobacteraceae bacterium]